MKAQSDAVVSRANTQLTYMTLQMFGKLCDVTENTVRGTKGAEHFLLVAMVTYKRGSLIGSFHPILNMCKDCLNKVRENFPGKPTLTALLCSPMADAIATIASSLGDGVS